MAADLVELKLMADYDCFPTWLVSNGELVNVDPNNLELPADLVRMLDEWRYRYDATLDREDPIASGFVTEHDEITFVEDGRTLARALAIATNNRYRVMYRAEGSKRLEEISGA